MSNLPETPSDSSFQQKLAEGQITGQSVIRPRSSGPTFPCCPDPWLSFAAGPIHNAQVREIIRRNSDAKGDRVLATKQTLALLSEAGFLSASETTVLRQICVIAFDLEKNPSDKRILIQRLYDHLVDTRGGELAIAIGSIAIHSAILGETGIPGVNSSISERPKWLTADIDGAFEGAGIGGSVGGLHGAVIGAIIGGGIRSAMAV